MSANRISQFGRRFHRIWPLLVVGALILVMWQGRQTQKAMGAQGAGLGQMAPNFTLPMLQGGQLRLAALRGKVVVLDFFTSWCTACRAEAGDLEHLALRYGNRVEVVGVDMFVSERNVGDVKGFVENYGTSFPVVLDRTGSVTATYLVRDIPTEYVIGRGGVVRTIYTGEMSYAELKQAVQAATT